MVSRNYTVQPDKKSYHERSPNGSYGKGIHKNGYNGNLPSNSSRRKENIYQKHASVGTQFNGHNGGSSPVNSRYTYSTPYPKSKVDRTSKYAGSNSVDHYTNSNNNIDPTRITVPADEPIHIDLSTQQIYSYSDVQRINQTKDSHYHYNQYSNNIPSFNSFNNNGPTESSQNYKVRIPLTNISPTSNCGSNLPTIAESIMGETEYPVDVQQDYEVAKDNKQINNGNTGKPCVQDTKDDCYCKDTPYGSRSERFKYISENTRETNQSQNPDNKYNYQGTHPDSLYRVAQLVEGSHKARWWGRTSRLRTLYRLLRWPLALLAVILALVLLIYFLMPDTEANNSTVPFKNSSAEWDSQFSGDTNHLQPDMNSTTRIPSDDRPQNSTTESIQDAGTTKEPFAIIVEPDKDELNFGYNDDDTRDDEGIQSIIKLGPGLGLDPNIFHHEGTTTQPLFPKHLSPSVQYGNEHEDAASNEKHYHQPATEIYDKKIFTPSYAIYVNRDSVDSTTEGSNESEQKDDDKFLEQKPEISGNNVNKLKTIPRFTSGHQNSFGIPIEEAVNIRSTTQSNLYITRVSPTLPTMLGRNGFHSTTVRSKSNNTEDGICFSTRLSMCRGVLPYDLTTQPLIGAAKLPEVTPLLQLLLRSGCSPKTRQFLCSLLEPECRPRGMKVLAPCRSACEDIFNSCRDVIAAASSELAAVFDCSLYPVEEGDCAPLNEGAVLKSPSCPSGEWRCNVDGSCIAGHWRCDGISDCPGATDEQGCDDAPCGPNEFKCGDNGSCIPEEWVCDGHVDCLPEGTDERGCAAEGDSDVQGAASQHPRPVKLPRPPRLQTTSEKIRTANEVKPTIEFDSSKELLMMSDSIVPVRKPLPSSSNLRKKISTSSRVVTSTSSSISYHRSTLCAPGDPNCRRKVISSRLTPCARGSCLESRMTTTVATTPAVFNVTQKIEEMEAASGLTSHSSPCPQGELRCVDGRCITLEQLCDHHPDCSDGVDEANCFT